MISVIFDTTWYVLFVYIFSLSAIPFAFLLLNRIRGGGLILAKVLGLLLPTYIIWFIGHFGILSFSKTSIWFVLLVLFVLSAYLCFIWRAKLLSLFKRDFKILLIAEIVFLLSIYLFAIYKSHDNRIMDTEKYMDFGFFNSVYRGSDVPPQDQWYCGHPINYYYFGYTLMAVLAKTAGVSRGAGYNLSLAFLFALSTSLSFIIARTLTRNIWWGLIAVLTVPIIGNLAAFGQWVRLGSIMDIDYWKCSRVIVDTAGGETINEFPSFSFIHGDLHGHVMSIPYVLFAIVVLLNLVRSSERSLLRIFEKKGKRLGKELQIKDYIILLLKEIEGSLAIFGRGKDKLWILRIFLLSLSLGVLAFINGMDFPTFGFCLFGGLVFSREWILRRKITLGMIIKTGVLVAFIVGLSVFMVLPFFISFKSPIPLSESLIFTAYKSKLTQFLAVFLIQLFAVLLFWRSEWIKHSPKMPKEFSYAIYSISFLLFVCLMAIYKHIIFAVLPLLLFALLAAFYRTRKTPINIFVYISVLLSVCIMLGCEIICIKDTYGDKLQRMNTLFKFHYQAWLMLGVCLPFLVFSLWKNKLLPKMERGWLVAVFAFLVAAGLVFPLAIVKQRMSRYQHKPTLDGMYYLSYEHPDEYEAISWLNKNIKGAPVTLEASGGAYSYEARVSANTGLPTVLGWRNHESIWRAAWKDQNQNEKIGWDLTASRETDVRRIYDSEDYNSIVPLLEKYKIKYIFIGEEEKKKYSASGLAKFDSSKIVFSNKSVSIYKTDI